MMQNLEERSPRLAMIAIFFILLIDICATSIAEHSFSTDLSDAGDYVGRNGVSDSNRRALINGLHRYPRVMRRSYRMPCIERGGRCRVPLIIDSVEEEIRIPNGGYVGGSCPCSCKLGKVPYEIPVPHRRRRRRQNTHTARRTCIQHNGRCAVVIKEKDK